MSAETSGTPGLIRAGELIAGYQLVTLNVGGDGYECGPSLLGLFLAPTQHSNVRDLSTQFARITGIHNGAPRDALRRGGRPHQPDGEERAGSSPAVTPDEHWRQVALAEGTASEQIEARAGQLRAQGRQLVEDLSLWLHAHYGIEVSSVAQLFTAWLVRDLGWQSVQSETWSVSRYTTRQTLWPLTGPTNTENDPWPWRSGQEAQVDDAQQASWLTAHVAEDLKLSEAKLRDLWSALGWTPDRVGAAQLMALDIALFRIERPYDHMPVVPGTALDETAREALKAANAPAERELRFAAKLAALLSLGEPGLRALRAQLKADQAEIKDFNHEETLSCIHETIEEGWDHESD